MDDRCQACPLAQSLQTIATFIAEEVAKKLCPREEKHERLISAAEACKRLGWSRRTLDRRRAGLDFVRPRVTKGYDVLESGLDSFLRR